MKNRRNKLVGEILDHCDKIKANKVTVLTILAFETDKSLTGFHKEFVRKE